MKKFDLNIEKVLQDWETYHAVREVIANAIDEQVLTKTKDIEIVQDKLGLWHIRDFGRGLKYQHLTQKENEEKLQNPNLIGTDFILQGCSFEDIKKAKDLFLKFSGEHVLEKTQFGEVLSKNSPTSRIFINGVKAAEEENFLFSYNITSLTAAIRKALNRERTNVGRSAYSDRVKSILLFSEGKVVAQALVDDLKHFEAGSLHDELTWTDVSVHATKILNAVAKVVFLTPSELMQATKYVDEAKKAGYQIVAVPENVRNKIAGQTDLSGNPMQDLSQFKQTWNDSFKFKFVSPSKLTPSERAVYEATPRIVALIGGLPSNVREIKISETMRMETYAFVEASGLWEASTGTIIIKRDQLKSLEEYAGTLLHEIAHARSGAPDISSDFEKSLTELLGKTGSHIDDVQLKRGIISKLFAS